MNIWGNPNLRRAYKKAAARGRLRKAKRLKRAWRASRHW